MTVERAGVCAVVVLGALLSSSCSLFHRSAKARTRPAPTPAPSAQSAPGQSEPAAVPPAPELPPQPPDISQPPVTPPGKAPPPPRRRTPAATRPRQTPEAGPSQPAPEAAPPAAPEPQLGPILSPEQQQTFNEEIDRNIASAQRTIAALNGRRLNRDQQAYLERIRTFVQQALDARKTDLFRAKNLAERASLLATDLIRSVQ